jgi:hypothetical protein
MKLKFSASRVISVIAWLLFFALSVALVLGLIPMLWQNFCIMLIYLVVALVTSVWRGTGEVK